MRGKSNTIIKGSFSRTVHKRGCCWQGWLDIDLFGPLNYNVFLKIKFHRGPSDVKELWAQLAPMFLKLICTLVSTCAC